MRSSRTDSVVAESYIVRIYRRDAATEPMLVGTVHASGGSTSAFHNADELWAVLAGSDTGKSKRRSTIGRNRK